jgi:hypothetical protein
MKFILTILFLVTLTLSVDALIPMFASPSTFRRQTSLSMMFGGKKTATKIIINVDGKVIDCGDKPVNLRKELMANKIDVYPLRAKITGMNFDSFIIFFTLNM